MIAVVQLEQDHLVAGIQESEAGTVKAAGGTGADDDLRLRVVPQVVVASQLVRDGSSQLDQTFQPSVGIDAAFNGFLRGASDRERNLGIADALGEVDAADAFALHRHDADFGLRDDVRPLAELKSHGPVAISSS